MRTTLAMALMLTGILASPLWAQLGGGLSGGATSYGGEMMGGYGMSPGGYGEMMGMGYEEGGYGPAMASGIRAYGGRANEEGGLTVTWSGPEGAESQKLYESMRGMPSKLQFIDTPLPDVVQYLEQAHGISIVVDEAALKEETKSPDLPVSLRLDGVNAAVLLDLMTDRLDLDWYIDKGIVVITSEVAAEEHQTVRIYKLNQLSASGAKQIVETMITPGQWQAEGGLADIVAVTDRNLLVVRHNHAGHGKIESLLKSLESVK